MRRTAIVNGRLIVPGGTITRGCVVCAGDRIETVVNGDAVDPRTFDGDVIDAAGRVVTPGLIDLHVHGARGHSFDEADCDAVREIVRHHASRGITTLQASLVSASTHDLGERMSALAPMVRNPADAESTIAGIHLEGPFLASAQRGAHDKAVLRIPTEVDRELLTSAAGILTMITAAPELPGVLELGEILAAAGVVVAVGHSDAPGAALDAAWRAGFRHITHLWSGQSTFVRQGPWRVPGLLESSLASTGFTAEVIADGKHLPPALLEIARRCLGADLAVVSDATAGTGMPDGYRYTLGAVRCRVGDGVGMVEDAASFGGSTTSLDGMVRYLTRELDWPLPDVIRMMTATPARVLGAGHEIGSLASGRAADLVIWGEQFEPDTVILRGRVLNRDGITPAL